MVASVGAAPAATLSLCREPGPSAPQRRILRLAPGGPTPVSSGDLYPSHIMFRISQPLCILTSDPRPPPNPVIPY